ncbi:MAG TPA: cyanophycin synthetase, partial [Polyangiales bacterium]|nr:cyanophycin synthetase [Polyangiales bacterium]
HTPDSLENALRAARTIGDGRVLCVFGCGGDRDRGKRPMMGKLAAELAEVAVVTSDNPRSEPPEQILAEIEAGVIAHGGPRLTPDALPAAERGYLIQGDRRAAIELAVGAARAGDVVLIAGKGHEKTQIIGKRHEPFDDSAEAQSALARRSARLRGQSRQGRQGEGG